MTKKITNPTLSEVREKIGEAENEIEAMLNTLLNTYGLRLQDVRIVEQFEEVDGTVDVMIKLDVTL